jgi:hypothetical protein
MMANLMAFCLARYCERLLAAVGTCDARGYKAAMDKLQRDWRGEIFQDELTENESMPRPPQRDDAEGEKKYDTDIDSQEADEAMAQDRFGVDEKKRSGQE